LNHTIHKYFNVRRVVGALCLEKVVLNFFKSYSTTNNPHEFTIWRVVKKRLGWVVGVKILNARQGKRIQVATVSACCDYNTQA